MPLSPQERIRPARPSDWPELAALWRRSVEATHHFLQPSDLEAIDAAMLRAYLPAMRELWLLEREGRVAGFRGGDALRVEMLFVDPPFFGQGVGTALLRHACAGRRRVELDVNEQNTGARAFYARLGFRVCGRSPVDSDGRPYPLLHLVWEADGRPSRSPGYMPSLSLKGKIHFPSS